MRGGMTTAAIAGLLAASSMSGTTNGTTYSYGGFTRQPVIGRPSIDEQKRRIAAAQANRERRQTRNLLLNMGDPWDGLAIHRVVPHGNRPRLAAVAKRQKAKKTKHAIVKSIGKAGYRDAVGQWRENDGGWMATRFGKIRSATLKQMRSAINEAWDISDQIVEVA